MAQQQNYPPQQQGYPPQQQPPQQQGYPQQQMGFVQPAMPQMVVGRWDHGICGCFGDCGGCLYSTFCTCCAAGKAKSNVDGSNCFVNSILSCCCYICTAPCTRTKIRVASAIPGGGCQDCLCALCCPLCTVCQMHHQSKLTVARIMPPQVMQQMPR